MIKQKGQSLARITAVEVKDGKGRNKLLGFEQMWRLRLWNSETSGVILAERRKYVMTPNAPKKEEHLLTTLEREVAELDGCELPPSFSMTALTCITTRRPLSLYK
jgi:hypothetical protein